MIFTTSLTVTRHLRICGLPQNVNNRDLREDCKPKRLCVFKYEGFKAKTGELLETTYGRLCLLLNEVRKNKFVKKNLEINIKFLTNLLPEWKSCASNISQNWNLSKIDIHYVFELLNQNQDDVSELAGYKDKEKKKEKEYADPLALIVEKSSRSRSSRNHEKFESQNSDLDNE